MLTVETAVHVFDCISWSSSSRDRKGEAYPVELFEIGGRVLWEQDPYERTSTTERKCKSVLSTLLIRPEQILESVARKNEWRHDDMEGRILLN